MVAAECAPFAKSGGLGDVVGALPQHLAKNGKNRVIIIMPLYSMIDRTKYNIRPEIGHLGVSLGVETLGCAVYRSEIPGNVPVYFLGHNQFFDRPGMYHDNAYNDYPDNPVRFAFLSSAALSLCRALDFHPDIIHSHDWHTALLPAFARRFYTEDHSISEAATILTIHNIAYQGRYDKNFYFSTGLGWQDFTQDKFEHYGDVNFLKGGIHFADIVNTVSKGYAAETRKAPGGYGLEYFLNQKGDDYVGILNGADYSQWNPEIDKLIPANYSAVDLSGKAVCKERLQEKMGLEKRSNVPVIGVVSRLVEQKGFQIIAECIDDLLNEEDVQFAILGSGENSLESFYSGLPERFPAKAGVVIGYDNDLAHLIEAGSDFFLMPSIYEPCGLNQIYSLKYGTLPIVRATGGLDDTIDNYKPETGEGTGFKFMDATCKSASDCIRLALDTYHNRKEHIAKLISNAMSKHFSWDDSAAEYLDMYRRAIKKNSENPAEITEAGTLNDSALTI